MTRYLLHNIDYNSSLPKSFVPMVPRTPSAATESTLKLLLVMMPPLSASEEVMPSDPRIVPGPSRENGRRDSTVIDRLVIGLDAERQRTLVGVCYVLHLKRVDLHDGNWQQRLLNAGISTICHVVIVIRCWMWSTKSASERAL